MEWIITLLIFTSCAFLIVGDRLSELIRNSYVNHSKEIFRIYLYFEENGFRIDEVNVCDDLVHRLGIFVKDGPDADLYTIAKLKRGTFNDNEGFVLILDDLSEIDIPAMIQRELKDKNGKDVPSHGKAFVYYAIVYMEEEKMRLDRAIPSGKLNERNMTVFFLHGAYAIEEYNETYNDRNSRKYVERWFDKYAGKEEFGMRKCEEWSEAGLLNETPDNAWNIINAEIISCVEKKSKKKIRKQKLNKNKIGDFYVRLTNNIELKLIGIIICKVKSQISSSQNITDKYFTVTYMNGEENIHKLFGPISIDGKQIFVLRNFLDNKLYLKSLNLHK